MSYDDCRTWEHVGTEFNRDFAELIGQQQMIVNRAHALAVKKIAQKLRALQKRYHNHEFVFEDDCGSRTITITNRRTRAQAVSYFEHVEDFCRFPDLRVLLLEVFYIAENLQETFGVNVGSISTFNTGDRR